MDEIWKVYTIKKYGWYKEKNRIYEVSNKGNVKIDGILQELEKKTYTRKKKYLETFNKKAYIRCAGWLVHRAVAELFIPNPENKKYVDHIDGNPWNNDVTNLRWVTNSENMLNKNTNTKFHTSMKEVCSLQAYRDSVSKGCKQSFIDRPERREKCAVQRGKKWMNNGISQCFVKPEDIDNYLNNGWKLGRLPFTEEHKANIRLAQYR